MNGMGLSLSEICCLFCCPPCPSKIAAKLAFLPPEPTYTFEVRTDQWGIWFYPGIFQPNIFENMGGLNPSCSVLSWRVMSC